MTNAAAFDSNVFEPDPYYETTEELGWDDPDVCIHGKGFDEICVLCCPEDDDGSFTGDEWS